MKRLSVIVARRLAAVATAVALFGLGMYVALLGLVALRWLRPDSTVYVTATTFALSLAGVIFAGYLTYVELFVLEAICQWCVVSAVLTALLLLTEGVLVARLMAIPEEE